MGGVDRTFRLGECFGGIAPRHRSLAHGRYPPLPSPHPLPLRKQFLSNKSNHLWLQKMLSYVRQLIAQESSPFDLVWRPLPCFSPQGFCRQNQASRSRQNFALLWLWRQTRNPGGLVVCLAIWHSYLTFFVIRTSIIREIKKDFIGESSIEMNTERQKTWR